MATKTTPRQRDIEGRLLREAGQSLVEWLTEQRRAGISYRGISLDLRGLTGDSVSDEALRGWCSAFGIEGNGGEAA